MSLARTLANSARTAYINLAPVVVFLASAMLPPKLPAFVTFVVVGAAVAALSFASHPVAAR